MVNTHSFHIPVMGIAYTIDSPLKVSQYGIDSVISLVDDILLEKLRKMYCEKFKIPYSEITNKISDFRAKRITSYLNLINDLSKKNFQDIINAVNIPELKRYINLSDENSIIKQKFKGVNLDKFDFSTIKDWLKKNLHRGSIDVNIMTKLDKENYIKGIKLPTEFNDAHAALRAYAKSNLTSSIVLSAGMNPRLYSYIEQFEDFYPDKDGFIKKKIALKVSDYRSALIQGKFLAKKGLWVSEYRIESGLNCGGHAFATDGHLMGPILDSFKNNKEELLQSVYDILKVALINKNRNIPNADLQLKITAQGGVGTAEEHKFLINHYNLDSVGWGSPFLLVPEATTVDEATMNMLMDAKEKDLYLSNISPLGVPFNSVRANTKDAEKRKLIDLGKPGSTCPKKYLSLNNEYGGRPICSASRGFLNKKLKDLENENLSDKDIKLRKNVLFEKSCICVGLGTSALLNYNLDTEKEGKGVSVCPGPNMAYFSKKMSLEEITKHIYVKTKFSDAKRPNLFIKELNIYIKYIKNKFSESNKALTKKEIKYFTNFINNLQSGISYYNRLFSEIDEFYAVSKREILKSLYTTRKELDNLTKELDKKQVLKRVLVKV